MDRYLQVLVAAGSRDEAGRIADALVSGRRAACVQVIGPITSTFRWEGRLERAEEWLCVAKTTEDRYGDLEDAVRAIHSYEVPEITAVPVVAGGAGYLAWVGAEVRG